MFVFKKSKTIQQVLMFRAKTHVHHSHWPHIEIFSYYVGFSRFSESVTYYLANVESTSHNDIRQNTFEGEMLSAYEILFNVWIKSNEAKVHYAY